MGDPAGIGPEISLRAALEPDVRAACHLVLVGDRIVMEETARRLGRSLEGVEVLDTACLDAVPPFAQASRAGGEASYAAITRAIDESIAGRFQGVVTAPINKLSLKLAGIDFPGHTEIFGERTGAPHFAMMMYSERLAVGLVTCHQSLASVPGSLTVERIAEVGRLLSEAVRRIRGHQPRLAVLGLNPHAGESGLFGDEESRVVIPAIDLLRAEGYQADGPLPPDTAFSPGALSRFDAHLCLYHDQGLIPFKMISFEDGVNVTMGLPFVRTSVDHGTAFDIAGKGVANIGSLKEAIFLAAKLAV
ncbi:4-hydroxythreonine-4-phosphate dehydrogenase PdxA [bacterium]|nr:4-hydroxythreonine-4-phosphate dehydrogenase PdxA [bacterium]